MILSLEQIKEMQIEQSGIVAFCNDSGELVGVTVEDLKATIEHLYHEVDTYKQMEKLQSLKLERLTRPPLR